MKHRICDSNNRKMLFLISVTLTALFISSCHHSTAPDDEIKTLTATFTLTDTTGHPASQFHSGEEFVLLSSITNATQDTLIYRFDISFKIIKNDSVIIYSTDGCSMPPYYYPGDGHFYPGQTLTSNWIAPTPTCKSSTTILAPGSYQACVLLPYFLNRKVDSVAPIPFTIIP
ncbi:MAG TPA: hypothetical protein VMU30_04910 [Bacteroidota bacterium]|nr:hypothetical protein [Bacteroidota bacterium]